MNVKKVLSILVVFLLLLLTSSCAYFLERLDQNENDPIIEMSAEKTQTFCPINQSYFQIISQNQKSHDNFNKLLVQLESVNKFSFIDKAVLWSLIQMNLRPDLTAPQSRVQFLINYQGQQDYINYYQQKNEWSYLIALDELLKKYNSRYNLIQLANFIDKYHPDLFYVSKDFATFLIEKKSIIANDPQLKNIYMRADETLRENERVARQPLTPLIKKYIIQKKVYKNIKSSSYLFDYTTTKKISTRCNYDMGLYQNSIYLINDDFIRSNIFGLKEGKNTFITTTNQGTQNLTNLQGTIFFKGTGGSRAAALCSFESRTNQDSRNIWLVSSDSRDPGQHIYHLLEYGLQDITQIDELDKMLKFSRHLFLQGPVRLVFESNRSTKMQLQELLKLNIPIYYASNLGRIWGLYQSEQEHSFLLDDRKAGSLSCMAR